jgi:exodeoxyribonuclease V alpha subunit
MSDVLSGAIEHVTFHNPDTGFAVLRVKAKGHRSLVTVVGQTPRATAGEYVEATGTWKVDSEYGEQFQAKELRTAAPSTAEGIEKYLGSGLVKGIGPVYAKKIVQVFGEKTLRIIDESPTFLREVKGIGPKRIGEIRESWRQQKVVRDILVFLQSHGVGTGRAVRIYKTYGDQSVAKVKENPYRLANDVWGIGFATADNLAQRLGISADSPMRAAAALRHVLKECADDGHCAYPIAGVIEEAQKLTGISTTTLKAAAELLIDSKDVIREDRLTPEPWLYLKKLFFAERTVADRLTQLMRGDAALKTIDVGAAVSWVERKMGMELASQQKEAIRRAVTEKVVVITGGPGVGKTTLVRGIIEVFLAKGKKVQLAAPTGRAARRLRESTGQPALTLHRLLEYQRSGAKRDEKNPLDHDLLVVDEMSMVDIALMEALLRSLPAHASLVLVGDADQLPSVGPGSVLADLIASKWIPVVHLTQIFRQAEESGIVRAAYRVNNGELPESPPEGKLGDFYFIEVDDPALIQDRMVALIRDRIPARFGLDPLADVQILTPMNRADLGVRQLNQLVQGVLNAPGDEPEVSRFGIAFRPGDKVLQTVNNYDKGVFNGDIGRVKRVDLEEQTVRVDFDGTGVLYEFDELDELSLAYALTIHKSQGSEYPAVVIPLHTQHFLLLRRNLIYTAITRGRKLVVIVGSRKALETAVRRQDDSKRFTALAARLAERGSPVACASSETLTSDASSAG